MTLSAPQAGPRVGGVILAAGRSSRMTGVNKLLARVDGVAMVRRVAGSALAVALDPVVVVLGHDAAAVRRALDGVAVEIVVNDDHAAGMSTSVAAGVRAIEERVDGAMMLLGDMPWVSRAHLNALKDAFAPERGDSICVPTFHGKRGNPVLWAKRYFPELLALQGDVGARPLLRVYEEDIREVEVADRGVLRDVDTPGDLPAG